MITNTETHQITLDRMGYWSEKKISPNSIGRMVAIAGQLATEKAASLFRHESTEALQVASAPPIELLPNTTISIE